MRKSFLLAVLLVAITAGCVQASTSSTGKTKDAGIALQNFAFTAQSITDEEKASASFSVSNIGSKPVSGDIYVWLYGPFSGKYPWVIEPEGSLDISSGDAVIKGETFYPPVPEKSVPGSAKKYDITLTPPDLPEGTSQDYVFYAEICFPYTTSALAEIVSISNNEFTVQEKSDTSTASTSNTLGPISMKLSSRKNVRTNTKIPIVFTVEDAAGGYSISKDEECTLNIASTKRYKVDVSVFVDGSPDNLECGLGDNTAKVDLINGKGLVFCSYELPEVSAPKRTHTVSALAEYKYYARKSAGIKVEDAFSQ